MICMKCGQEIGVTTGHACVLITTYPPRPERRPWKCPLCEGQGTVWPMGDQTTVQRVKCHACGGTGIVWG